MKMHPLRAIGAAVAVLFTTIQSPLFAQQQTLEQQGESARRAAPAKGAKSQPAKLDRIAEKLKVAEPVSHKNLAVFLIEGNDRLDTSDVLTLGEALKKKGTIVVKETGNVNELTVTNQDGKHTVFIMAGDIVKGGQQDRTLASDLPLRKGAGAVKGGGAAKGAAVPVGAFCVESGRWHARGGEAVAQFDSSANAVASKEQKIAVRSAKNQSEVWEKVAKAQTKISENIGKTVNAAASPTSLQLSLEDKDLKKQTNEYLDVLKPIVAKSDKALGYVLVINGQINSAEIFASHDLLSRTWSKLAESAAIEAVSELKEKPVEKPATVNDAMDFLAKAEDAEAKEEPIHGSYWSVAAESPGLLLFQTVDKDRDGLWLRRSIIKK
jgi:hypothetical protein